MNTSSLAMKFILSGFLIAFWLYSCSTTEQPKSTSVSNRVPTMTTAYTAIFDSKAALHESINQALGTNDGNLPRLTKISYSDPEAGDITITWAIKGNLSEDATKNAAEIDAINIIKILKRSNTRFIYVILVGIFSAQDKDGVTTETQAMNLGFNKSKLDKVNWEDFQPSDVFDLVSIRKLISVIARSAPKRRSNL